MKGHPTQQEYEDIYPNLHTQRQTNYKSLYNMHLHQNKTVSIQPSSLRITPTFLWITQRITYWEKAGPDMPKNRKPTQSFQAFRDTTDSYRKR